MADKSLKVLYILPYDWGAMPHYTAEIANAMTGYAKVILLCSNTAPVGYFKEEITLVREFMPFSFRPNNIKKMFNVSNLSGFLSFRNIKVIRDINPDIIHLTTPVIPPLAIFLRMYKIDSYWPIIYTKHGIYSNSGFILKLFEENVLNIFENLLNYRQVIVHTQNDLDILKRSGRFAEQRLRVVPHGTYNMFRQYVDNSVAEEERGTVLFFGNIRDYKGLEFLIRAAPIVSESVPGVKIIIAGEGDLSPYGELTKNQGLFEIHNSFIPDEKVAELFKRSEVVVLPYSKMSGQSGILNIALAFNKPLVATDVGGISEVVKDGITGLVVKPGDVDELATALVKMLKDDNLKCTIRDNLANVADKLSWGNIAEQYVNLYRSALS
jgi:glycosyltransferase involved in cell wall biosynthesis